MKNFKLVSTPQTIELMESECIEFDATDKQYITVKDEFLPEELFDMAFAFGKQTEKSFWEKPETFQLPEKYATLLQQAKDEYQTDTYIQFTSLKIGAPLDNGTCDISFGPTQSIHMFGLCSRYGKLCAEFQKETVSS